MSSMPTEILSGVSSESSFGNFPETPLRVLCLGDVVGRGGRQVLKERLPYLKAALALDYIIANGENAAGGVGLTPETLRELLGAGVNVITSGNHIWKHREVYPHLDKNAAVLRPANYGGHVPGKGLGVYSLPCGTQVAVLNLLGRTFMDPAECPFRAADAALEQLQELGVRLCIVDFHAEATSEKRAMAHYLDGRASAVLGTHTHVQTADAFVSGQGTASVTDLGMCGIEDSSVLGVAKEPVLARFLTGLPYAFKPARGHASLNGVLLELDRTSGKALSIRLLRDNAAELLDGQRLNRKPPCVPEESGKLE